MDKRTRLESEDETDQSSGAAKRQKMAISNISNISNISQITRYLPKDYTVGWICALHIETAAARAMLDHIHDDLPRTLHDINTYTFGSIGHHNIVIASLPDGYYGTNNAATVASNIERSFPSIEIHLMVGIGGGAPGKLDLRLGDVVVGSRVMQYDLGKIVGDGQMERTGFSIIPPPKLLTYIAKLRAIHELTPSRVPDILQEMYNKHPQMATYARPNAQDRLFRVDFEHDSTAAGCDQCDASMLVRRLPRTNFHPKILYEAIASGNQVMKHGLTRDKIAQELQVACFEMEAAGLMNFPYLVIRGICDYSDSHKNKQWQKYAAATAAAYAKEFLNTIQTTQTATQGVESRDDEEPLNNWWQLFLKSLRFKQIDSRQSNIKAAYTVTCKWLLESPEYLTWVDSAKLTEHHGFLWLSGKPGAGKSTIMKFAYSRAKRAAGTTNAVVSFFFHARGDVLEKSITGMYRSLLLQLLEKFADLQKVCEDSNLVERNGSCPSLEATQILFRSAISMLGKRSLTCFIDALDECDELQVRDMVKYFEILGQQAVEEKIELRICFSSRHYPYISIRQGLRLTLENQKGHEDDIQEYVRGNLNTEPDPLPEEIVAQILQKAAGVFMWVVLVVDILNKEFGAGRMFAVKKKLAEIPRRLSDLFRDVLKRDNENMKDLLLSLRWILYAKRPLTREEYYFAVSTGIMDEDELTPEYLTSSISSDRMDKFVVSSSKGLAEVTKSNQPTVQFIHESVRDFLIKDHGFQELWPEFGYDFENPSHEKLKQCCYKYLKLGVVHILSYGAFPTNNEDVVTLRTTVSKRAPFLQYATSHVLYHADIAASSVLQDNFLNDFRRKDWIISNNLFEKYKIRRYTASASLFYILAEKGFSALIQAKLRHDSDCYSLGERYRYPIFAALINGHSDAVQTLQGRAASTATESDASYRPGNMRYDSIYRDEKSLIWAINNSYQTVIELLVEGGANVNAKDHLSRSALFLAADKGHTSTVKLLVEKGADVNATDIGLYNKTALMIAFEKGYNAITEILIAKGANVNAKDTNNWTALSYVIEQEHDKKLIKLLIENGADVNIEAQKRHGQPPLLYDITPLLYVMNKRYDDIIPLVIEKGADINVEDISGQTPLILAIQQRINTEIIQLLIEKGADINTQNKSGQTALILAIQQRIDTQIIQLLVEKSADINTQDKSGQTPLILAIQQRIDTQIIQLIVEKSADINTQDKSGQTALILAIQQRIDTQIIQLLIEKGADINTQDISNQTPLILAISQGINTEIIQLLIEKGADINAKDISNQTPLILAFKKERKNIIQLLIQKGVDINAKDNSDQTPLILAIKQENKDIIQVLLEKGVDMSILTKYDQTPLLYALDWGSDDDIIQLLIKQSEEIDAGDSNGRIPLLYAMHQQRGNNVIQLLIEKGANVNVEDKRGQTPLFLAVLRMNFDIIQLLIEKGADMGVKDNKGRTALNLSFEMGNYSITEFLIERGADPSSIGLGGTTAQERLDMHYPKSFGQ